jgi:hypothetical protein
MVVISIVVETATLYAAARLLEEPNQAPENGRKHQHPVYRRNIYLTDFSRRGLNNEHAGIKPS